MVKMNHLPKDLLSIIEGYLSDIDLLVYKFLTNLNLADLVPIVKQKVDLMVKLQEDSQAYLTGYLNKNQRDQVENYEVQIRNLELDYTFAKGDIERSAIIKKVSRVNMDRLEILHSALKVREDYAIKAKEISQDLQRLKTILPPYCNLMAKIYIPDLWNLVETFPFMNLEEKEMFFKSHNISILYHPGTLLGLTNLINGRVKLYLYCTQHNDLILSYKVPKEFLDLSKMDRKSIEKNFL